MSSKNLIKDKILNFKLSTCEEICESLGQRLKNQRLVKNLKQQELADRAGVSVGTVKNLESKGQSSLNTLVSIVIALDLIQELEQIFVLKIHSISEMEQIEKLRFGKIPRRAR